MSKFKIGVRFLAEMVSAETPPSTTKTTSIYKNSSAIPLPNIHPSQIGLAVVVGQNSYFGLEGLRDLKYAEADAEKVFSYFKSLGINSRLLNGKRATKRKILRECSNQQNGDYILIYFSGHGKDGKMVVPSRAGVNLDDIELNQIAEATNKKIILIVDACIKLGNSVIPTISQRSSPMQIITASKNGVASEAESFRGGIFTNYWVKFSEESSKDGNLDMDSSFRQAAQQTASFSASKGVDQNPYHFQTTFLSLSSISKVLAVCISVYLCGLSASWFSYHSRMLHRKRKRLRKYVAPKIPAIAYFLCATAVHLLFAAPAYLARLNFSIAFRSTRDSELRLASYIKIESRLLPDSINRHINNLIFNYITSRISWTLKALDEVSKGEIGAARTTAALVSLTIFCAILNANLGR